MQSLDTVHAFETPEGVDLRMRVAGPVVRAAALGIDSLIKGAVYFVMLLVLAPFGKPGMGAYLIVMFLLEWLYPVYFEARHGRTPGKKAMGLSVIHDNGTPVGWPSAMVRNLLRVVDFFPVLYGLGLLSMLVSRDFQRLGDLAAGTLVVYTERSGPRKDIPERPPRELPVDLPLAAQEAVLAFAERSPALSEARREELAEYLSGYSRRRGYQAVEALLAHANWLARGR